MGKIRAPHQTLGAIHIVNALNHIVRIAVRIGQCGSLLHIGNFDINIGILTPIEQIGEQRFGIGFIRGDIGNVINHNIDLGKSGNNGFNGLMILSPAKQIEAQTEIPGTRPQRILIRRRQTRRIAITRQMNAHPTKPLFSMQTLQLIRCIG